MRVSSLRCLLFAGVVACADSADRAPADGEAQTPIATPDRAGQTSGSASVQGTTRGGGFADPAATSTAGTSVSRPAQPPSPEPSPGAPLPGPNGGASPGGNSAVSDHALPCDVATILRDKCQTCHGDPLISGPMPLTKWSDLQAASTTVPGSKIAERVAARINDGAKPMPPVTRPALTAAEKQILLSYLNAGAPRSAASCDLAPSKPGGSAEGARPPDSDCDYIQELRGHGGQTDSDSTPFTAPNGGDHYEMFYFRPKWSEKVQVIHIDPIIDNGQILHHWLLYMEEGDGSGDGTHESDLGLQSPSSVLLSGWAPGNGALPLASDIGLQVISGSNARFAMEIHYNTSSNPTNRSDRSGARLCATKKLRPKEAAIHWLGTQAIIALGAPIEASGTCTVQTESHIIAHSPHMHMMGRHMKTIVTKRGGKEVTITDQPFSFDDQRVFPIDNASGEIAVGPGDVIETTCSYAAGVFTFGPDTDQEMCYNFLLAWPAGSLSNGLPGLVGGQNTCIDTFI